MKQEPHSTLDDLDKIAKAIKEDAKTPPVIIVEDNEADAIMLSHRLATHGIEIISWSKTVDEAISELRSGRKYRLMFLDLNLCGLPGNKVLEESKKVNPECYVVVLTGYYEPDSPECHKSLKLGADAVMLKPLESDKIKLLFNLP